MTQRESASLCRQKSEWGKRKLTQENHLEENRNVLEVFFIWPWTFFTFEQIYVLDLIAEV